MNDFEKIASDSKSDFNENDKPKRTYSKRSPKEVIDHDKIRKENIKYYSMVMHGVLQFSGTFLSSGTKFPGFEMSNDELDALSAQGGEIMNDFAPEMQSKYFKLSIFTVSLCAVYGGKYMAYTAYMKTQPKPVMKQETKLDEVATQF